MRQTISGDECDAHDAYLLDRAYARTQGSRTSMDTLVGGMSCGRDIPRAFAEGSGSDGEMLSVYLESVSMMMAEHKRDTIDAMGLRPGDSGLDVGCGLGDEVRLIADRVGPSGRAVGIDVNDALLAIARQRTTASVQVAFQLADAHALPFADGEFAAARVERALQHMTDPRGAIAEMARVVHPGGRLVALEPDWETLVISSPSDDTARTIRDELLAGAASPTVGRNLARYFDEAGLALQRVEAHTLVIRDPATADRLFLLHDAAKRVGTAAASEWWDDLTQATAQGGFCAALTQFLVVAIKPAV